jgi:flagellar basal-body rod modification protein FlgD
MTTSAIGNNAFLSSLQSSSSATASSGTSGMGSLDNASTFYNLLVTQLTNQDPLNPMSSTQMSAQLAQFSTASSTQAIESSMATMTAQLNQTQGLQAANLVGQNVIFDSNSISLGSSGSTAGGFTLSGAANNATVQIENSSGQTVQTLQMGALSAGVQSFSWDGTEADGTQAPAGNYTFNVQATNSAGQSVAATPFGTGTVQAVYLGSTGPSLQIQGQSSPVSLSNIQGVV